jgi:Fe2+ transport system protein FeoA
MPLAMARPGEAVELVNVRGGMGLQRRLAEIGLGPGSRFTVETNGRPGPFIIRVFGSRLILGHGMVTRVFVRPVKQETGEPSR